MAQDLLGGLDTECIHLLTVRTCSFCLGAMTKAPYRQALKQIMPGFLPETEENRRDCEFCPTRGATKGNRINVRVPRPPMNAFGQGVPPYPPSFSGPTVERPRIYKATHRTENGHYSCDRCHPEWAAQRPDIRHAPKSRDVATAMDIFI